MKKLSKCSTEGKRKRGILHNNYKHQRYTVNFSDLTFGSYYEDVPNFNFNITSYNIDRMVMIKNNRTKYLNDEEKEHFHIHELNSTQTNNEKPASTESYIYQQLHKKKVQNTNERNVNQGIMYHFISAVWVVAKVMHRQLNKYRLPNILYLLEQFGKYEYFSLVDLASGFNQKDEDILKPLC